MHPWLGSSLSSWLVWRRLGSYALYNGHQTWALTHAPYENGASFRAWLQAPFSKRALVRISYCRLEYVLLCADVLIIAGLVVVACGLAFRLAEEGVSPSVSAVRWQTSGTLIGTTVMAFEGVPLMLPIRASTLLDPDLGLPTRACRAARSSNAHIPLYLSQNHL
jgi:hypothetical protein